MSSSNSKYEKSSFFSFSGDFSQTIGDLGLISCTETLGFESSDERIADERLDARIEMSDCSTTWDRVQKRSEQRRRVVELPPPLTSLDKNGRRDFVLRSVREDGRLKITAVRVHRPEIMLATRENGRLTLQLVENQDEKEDEEEEKTEEEERGFGSPVIGGEGEGEAAMRRCYEYEVAGQQHLSVWSPRCVTTM